MTSVDRFGIASLRTTEGPRRLPDHGLTSATALWVATYLLTEPTDDEAAVYAASLRYAAHCDFARQPGTLGDPAAYADTCEPDGTRICTVDDLLAFRKDG